MAQKQGIKLTYFPIAGVAERVRLAFVLGGVPFEDHRINPATEWAALKPTTPNGQLPVMHIEGRGTICQSDAMLRYAATLTPSLYPADKALEVDEMMGLTDDLVRDWRPMIYLGMRPEVFGYPAEVKGTEEHAERVKTLRVAFVQNDLPKYMKLVSDKIEAAGGAFVAGPEPTIADCHLVPALRNYQKGHIDHVPTTCLDEYPVVIAYIKRFLELPTVKAYYEAQK